MNDLGSPEDSDVIFRDVILLALTGFISMVLLLLPFVNPPTEEESSSTPPGNVIVELFWDEQRDVDIKIPAQKLALNQTHQPNQAVGCLSLIV